MWARIYHVHLLLPDQMKEEKEVGSTWGQIFDDLYVKVFYLRGEALDNFMALLCDLVLPSLK